ncbi:MAG: hypothetical protein ACTS27_03945 [Phycisphaerales bacterium]
MKILTAAALAAGLGASALAANVTVYSNNAGGDAFANVTAIQNQGQAVNNGWHYNNVRTGAVIGINSTIPRNGNGSVVFAGVGGAAKADMELLSGAVEAGGNYYATSSFGQLSDLSSLSYDWYRDGASTTGSGFHAVVRILVDADGDLNTTGDRGGLVFERAYNGGSVPTDSWQTDDVLSANGGDGAYMWNFGLGIGFGANINGTAYAYDSEFAEWEAYFPNASVIGFSMGIGSGWSGEFFGAVDNFTFGFNGNSTTYNFEVDGQVIPSPLAGGMAAAGLLGVAGVRRRR